MVLSVLCKLLNTSGWSLVLAWDLGAWLVTDRWKLNLAAAWLLVTTWCWWWSLLILVWVVALWERWLLGLSLGSALTILLSLALGVLLLLASLPLLANLLEL